MKIAEIDVNTGNAWKRVGRTSGRRVNATVRHVYQGSGTNWCWIASHEMLKHSGMQLDFLSKHMVPWVSKNNKKCAAPDCASMKYNPKLNDFNFPLCRNCLENMLNNYGYRVVENKSRMFSTKKLTSYAPQITGCIRNKGAMVAYCTHGFGAHYMVIDGAFSIVVNGSTIQYVCTADPALSNKEWVEFSRLSHLGLYSAKSKTYDIVDLIL